MLNGQCINTGFKLGESNEFLSSGNVAPSHPRRALVSFSYPPEFDRDSGSRRVLDLIDLLIALGWQVTFIASNRTSSACYCRALQQRGVALFDGSKTSTEELLNSARFDLAVLAMWSVAEVYLPIIRRVSPHTRVIVDSVDLNFLRNARRCFQNRSAENPNVALDDRYGAELVRELNVYAAADAVLTVSQKEADWVNDLIASPGLSQVVPDLEDRPISPIALEERRGILFMGSFRHFPNIGAVEFLCREILPRLDPELVALHPVYIVGEGLDRAVRALAGNLPHVKVVGWVPSVGPYLERARVSVVPLRYGAGTKRKLLQSLMAGTPAVSTSIGAEGFALESRKHLLVADDAEGFAAAITELLSNDRRWKRLSLLGRLHVSKKHRREAVLVRLGKVIEKVLAAKPKTIQGPTATKTNARMDQHQYQAMLSEVQKLAGASLPPNAKVIVVSRGDENLLKLGERSAWHFPQTPDGVYAGWYPADSAEAIKQLEVLRRAKGATHVIFPQTALWWLEHYAELREHLESNALKVVRHDGLCVFYFLAPLPSETPQDRTPLSVSVEAQPIDQKTQPQSSASVRLIAFYLPQFHPIPENDLWWGQGFTEWTNVGRAQPLFTGHYQPHVPADLGFYDLRLADTRRAQANLARQYGVSGYCYYHYWFKGQRLLERPFNEILLGGETDFPFCLCWANEPWSRRWNGRPEEVLRAQEYSPEDDLAHIRWLLPALADQRAIRIENKPVFIVYQARDLPNPAQTVEIWRREVARAGLPGIYLIAVETGRDSGWNATQVGFDAKLLFQPQFTSLSNSGADILIPGKEKLRVYDYQKAAKVLSNPTAVPYRRYDSVFPNWDNSPRRGEEAVVLHNSTPAAYEAWLRHAIQRALIEPLEHRVVFLNAWNEWGEGCHLEPDVRSGRAYLEATRRALAETTSPPAVNGHLAASNAVETALECGSRLESQTGSSVSKPMPSAPAQVTGAADSTYLSLLASARGERSADFVPLAESDVHSETLPVKAIAFYLPQFHPIPENDEWWGRGFTEWTNVSKAVPEFVGHYQPHLPGELGFYDLRVPEVQRRQVQLARKYGVHGFCFYYYWFAGKQLLERPLNQFISDPEIDFPFCICWANENWTRGWDGKESEILVAQHHSEEADIAFIRDLEPKLRHKNYIRIQGRPLLIVYRARLLPELAATAQRWRDYCRQMGLANPYLVAAQVFEDIDPREFGFDAAVQFPPNTPGPRSDLRGEFRPLNPEFTGLIHSYSDLIRLTLERAQPPYQQFKTVCPGWDNDARRPGRGTTYALSSPKEYGRWLKGACRHALEETEPDKRLVFINAWNEWGEGAHLEPDRRYGYAYLQTTAQVLTALPKRVSPSARDWTILFVSHDAHSGGAQTVLLNQIAWLKQHTGINLKVLCLESGTWLSRFQELAQTTVLSEIKSNASNASDEAILVSLREFCGGIPGLIYANSVASGRAFASLRQLGAPILTHFHELESSIRRYAGAWIKDVLDHSTHYLACCDAVRDNLIDKHSVPHQALSTVYESIRPDPEFKPLSESERTAARARLGLAPGKRLVFGCGLGMPFRKGADLFIKVALEVNRQGREDCHFYWIGDFHADEHDPQHGAWVDHLNRLPSSVGAQISFLGRKENPGAYFQTADVFLLPSREDPFPLVALEAAERSIPIICFSGAGGVPDLVKEDAGFVVPFGDVRTMADRLITLLDDAPLRSRLGAQARKKVISKFTTDYTAPHVLSISRQTARKKPAVSVIMPGYNHAQYLQERLSSILQQTYRDFEVILLDDASTDNSLEILEQYRDHADVRIVRNEKNSGSTFKQWLKGIELAQADLIWIAESDDRCELDFLESLLPSFHNPKVKLAYANSHVMDEHGNVTGDYTTCEYLTSLSNSKWTKNYCVTAEEEINDGLGVKNTILSASAAVFRRFELTPEKCAVLETMRLAGDWFLFTHAIADGNVSYTARKLNYHRRHSESVIGKLVRQNRVTELFGEFYCVQNEIFKRYQLRDCFQGKWERYLRDQWHAFYPERPFDDLKSCYPFDQARAQIVSAGL